MLTAAAISSRDLRLDAISDMVMISAAVNFTTSLRRAGEGALAEISASGPGYDEISKRTEHVHGSKNTDHVWKVR